MTILRLLRKIIVSFILVGFGLLLGFTFFSGVQPRDLYKPAPCQERCWSEKEILGLIGSVVVTKTPSLLPLIYETDYSIVIEHPNPEANIHYVIIPKKDIKDIGSITPIDEDYLIDIFSVMQYLIQRDNLITYRVITNGPGMQEVRYLHFHLRAEGPGL